MRRPWGIFPVLVPRVPARITQGLLSFSCIRPCHSGTARPQTPRQRFHPCTPIRRTARPPTNGTPAWNERTETEKCPAGGRGKAPGRGGRETGKDPVFTQSSTTGLMTGLFLYVKIRPSTGDTHKRVPGRRCPAKNGFRHAALPAGDQAQPGKTGHAPHSRAVRHPEPT